MTQYAIFIQDGFGLESQSLYFTDEAPRYEADSIPVFARVGDTEERVQVGEREALFCVFTPLNGPYRMRRHENRVPFHRVLSVVEQANGNSDEKGDRNV